LYLPVLTIIFLKQNLNYFDVSILLFVYYIILALFEIPSGSLADIFGYKHVIVLGEIFKGIGLLILWLGENFQILILGQVFCGLGYVLASGADSALLYSTCTKLNKSDEYKIHESRSHGYVFVSILLAGILGGIVAGYDIKLPLILTVPFHFAAMVVALTFIEFKDRDRENTRTTFFIRIIDNLKEKPVLLGYTALYAIFRAIILTIFVYIMPLFFFIKMKIDIIYFGLILGSFTLISFNIGRNANKIVAIAGERNAIFIMIATLFGSILCLIYGDIFGLLAPALMGISAGLIRPLALWRINELVISDIRATILSFAEFLYGICNALFILLVGYITNIYDSIPASLNVLLVLAVVVAILFSILFIILHRNIKDTQLTS